MLWRWWYVSLGFLVLVVLFVLVAVHIPRTRVVELDIINGRNHIVEKLYGVTFRDEIIDTDFSRLVEQYNLEGRPEWVTTSYNGLGLFGGFRMCGYMKHGQLHSNYRRFMETVYPYSSIDDPTTYIVEMRRLAKIADGDGVNDLLTTITTQEDWPTL